jgi:hypothetical protein
MKVTRFLLSILFLGAMATTAAAQPSAQMTWDDCVNPVDDKAVAPGSVARLYVSATGMTEPHRAYQTFIFFGSGNNGPVRDAWRFDDAGCQTAALREINHTPPALLSKTCPAMTGANSLQIKNYTFDPVTGKALGLLASTYADVTPVPTTRYLLAEFVFNHAFSVIGPSTPGATCGGLEVALCAHFSQERRTSWLDTNGVEHPFAISNEYLTANDPGNSVGCPGATPVRRATWGEIKGQYKR